MKIRGRKDATPINPVMPGMDGGRLRETPGEEAPSQPNAVSVDLSASSRGVRHAREILATLSDVRSEKVAQIKQAIADGSYEIRSYEIARKMVDEALRESLTRRKK